MTIQQIRLLSVFTGAIKKGDSRMKSVYFDACGIAIPGRWENKADLIVERRDKPACCKE
jgi:hypothetical protein